MNIGVLSDTHGFLDDKLFDFFKVCDEIWHAGDIGDPEILFKLGNFKPLIAVFGNIDGTDVRAKTQLHQRKKLCGLDIWMTHIGGYPGNYFKSVKDVIENNPPDIFITGHSHILKVMRDKKNGLLHINPGAAGRHGLQKVRTAVRFSISNSIVKDFEIIELGSRSKI
jgi:uncharacterized protein